jgi:RNA recognition motif-containing protein
MSRQLYVGNLGNSVASFDLENLFADYGTIISARIKTNAATGKCSGCGVVEMSTQDEADAAVAALHGSSLDGRAMTVRASPPARVASATNTAPPDPGPALRRRA